MRKLLLALLVVALLLACVPLVFAQDGIIPNYEWRPWPPDDSPYWITVEVTRGRVIKVWSPPQHPCDYWDQVNGTFVAVCP